MGSGAGQIAAGMAQSGARNARNARATLPRPNAAEDLFAFQCRARKMPEPVRQFAFAAELGRKWRADFAWPDYKLLLEVQGAVFTGGRHTRGAGYSAECERRAAAVGLGYAIIEATTAQVRSGKAAQWAGTALKARGCK